MGFHLEKQQSEVWQQLLSKLPLQQWLAISFHYQCDGSLLHILQPEDLGQMFGPRSFLNYKTVNFTYVLRRSFQPKHINIIQTQFSNSVSQCFFKAKTIKVCLNSKLKQQLVYNNRYESLTSSSIINRFAMQRIENQLAAIKNSIKSQIKDHSLVSELNKELQYLQLTPDLVPSFTKIVFALYDLSNHHTLVHRNAVKNGPVQFQHDDMALTMKLTVFKMLSSLVVFYTENPSIELPLPLFRESLEIMVLIARIFIDIGQQTEIKHLYTLVNTFHQVTTGVSPEIELLHYLNSVELMRMDVDRSILDIYDFKKNLDAFYEAAKKISNSSSYIQLAQHITLEVVLKLIKMGHSDKCKLLRPLLPQKLIEVLNSVTNFESRLLESDLPQMKISPFYELFLSLKEGGSKQISEERLRAFIATGDHYKDPRIFDVVALTGCLFPLQIWLETYINTKEKCQNISNAYKCFIFMIDKYFCTSSSKLELVEKYQQELNQITSYMKICQLVMLALVLEKKETQEPVLFILKRVLKVMIHCILNLYPNTKDMKDFGDKSLVICSKFGLGDLARSIHCILFYYEVLMGTANQDSFNKFYKSNLMEQSSNIFKTVKLAYEIRTNKISMASEDIESIKRQPYLAILFQKQMKNNIILSIIPQQFCVMPEKFEIYFMLASNLTNIDDGQDLHKLVQHMEETLIRMELSQITKLDLRYISAIVNIFMKFLDSNKQKQNTNILCKVNAVLLYLVSINSFSSQISSLNTGILLNRYSKLIKILSFSFESLKNLSESERNECIERYMYLSKSMLCWSLQQLKLLHTAKITTVQPGSIVFFDLLHNFIMQNEKLPQNIEFIRFVRFEISCLTDTVNESEISFEKNFKLLKLYCASHWIKKNVKLKILRKMIKEDLISQSRQLSLQDLNDLILLTDNHNEKKMYAEYLIKLFGEQGKTYMMMQASLNPKGYEFLSDQTEDDDATF